MNGYISAATGGYYEGDRAHALDTEVPKRPDHRATWDGQTWQLDAVAVAREEAIAEIARLEKTEGQGAYIRGVREFMLGSAQMFNATNTIIQDLAAKIREIGGPAYADFQPPALPDISQSTGMRNIKTLDDKIKPLRSQAR
jgi:hypothetical protein